ncbi:BsuBI/PstI family type II restriction endonuclease [Candidatus Poriferisocius sp.]|uniref:BsuBI/PstI family type II restriction endonuclease n=1 Tax=Candidatus Poriferisocius sp. TaxID=3101276 RepID=UPI003B5A9EDC
MTAIDRRRRIQDILTRLGLYTAEREECIIALIDDESASPFSALAVAGYKFSAGAGTQQIFRAIAPQLGKTSIDREARDTIMLPLREVGILGIAYVNTKECTITYNYWHPKSPNNVYFVIDEFRSLLRSSEDTFFAKFETWIQSEQMRLLRLASSEAAAAASHLEERLVPLTVNTYCADFLPTYEVVFIDDTDTRSDSEWSRNIDIYNLPLDLSSRWPDIILRDQKTSCYWIVDCVESDGEIDAIRKDEIQRAFEARGHQITGYTTVYRTISRFAQRQRGRDNIAPGTFVWIMELGAAHWPKIVPHEEKAL